MSGNPFELLRSLLHAYGVKEVSPGRLRAVCPVCGGKNRSTLSAGEGDNGAVLLRCWKSECSVEAICAALGIEVADLFPPRPAPNGYGSGPIKRRRLLTAGQALDLLDSEAHLLIVCASDMYNGDDLGDETRERLLQAAARISMMRSEVRA